MVWNCCKLLEGWRQHWTWLRDPEIYRNIKPEESQGFVSVSEVRAAGNNVDAILSGNPQIPSPPAQGQDHRARLEVYGEIQKIIGSLGDTIANRILTAVMQAQAVLLQQEEEKQATPQKVPPLKKPEGIK